MGRLLNCVSDGNSLFNRMADVLRSVPNMREKAVSMRALFDRYVGTFAQADFIFMARLMYTQLHERDAPHWGFVAIPMTNVMMRRGKLFKAFWDGFHRLISDSCPSCVARGIVYGGGRDHIHYEPDIDDRHGTGCLQVDQYVWAYFWIRLSFSIYYGPISNYAHFDMHQQSPSDDSTLCKIYVHAAEGKNAGCYGPWHWFPYKQYRFFTDHRSFKRKLWCYRPPPV